MVKTVSTATIRSFEPEWDGNKELSVSERIVIEHKAPTINMKERLFPREFESGEGGNFVIKIQIDRKKVLREMVTGIRNLSAVIDGIERKIATVDQLFEAGVEFDELVEEMYSYCTNLINQKESSVKN